MTFTYHFVDLLMSLACNERASDFSMVAFAVLGYFTFRAVSIGFEVLNRNRKICEGRNCYNKTCEVESISSDYVFLKQSDLQPEIIDQTMQELRQEILEEKQLEVELALANDLEDDLNAELNMMLQNLAMQSGVQPEESN